MTNNEVVAETSKWAEILIAGYTQVLIAEAQLTEAMKIENEKINSLLYLGKSK